MALREPSFISPTDDHEDLERHGRRETVELKLVEKKLEPFPVSERLQGTFDKLVGGEIYVAEANACDYAEFTKQQREARKRGDEKEVLALQEKIESMVDGFSPAMWELIDEAYKGLKIAKDKNRTEEIVAKIRAGKGSLTLTNMVNSPTFAEKYREVVLTDSEIFTDMRNRSNTQYVKEKMGAVREKLAVGQGSRQAEKAKGESVRAEARAAEVGKEAEAAAEKKFKLEMEMAKTDSFSDVRKVLRKIGDIVTSEGRLHPQEEQEKLLDLCERQKIRATSEIVNFFTNEYGLRDKVLELLKRRTESFEAEDNKELISKTKEEVKLLDKILTGKIKPGEWLVYDQNSYTVDKTGKLRYKDAYKEGIPGVYASKQLKEDLTKILANRKKYLGTLEEVSKAGLSAAALDEMDGPAFVAQEEPQAERTETVENGGLSGYLEELKRADAGDGKARKESRRADAELDKISAREAKLEERGAKKRQENLDYEETRARLVQIEKEVASLMELPPDEKERFLKELETQQLDHMVMRDDMAMFYDTISRQARREIKHSLKEYKKLTKKLSKLAQEVGEEVEPGKAELRSAEITQLKDRLLRMDKNQVVHALEERYQVDVVTPSTVDSDLITKLNEGDEYFRLLYSQYRRLVTDETLMRTETKAVLAEDPGVEAAAAKGSSNATKRVGRWAKIMSVFGRK